MLLAPFIKEMMKNSGNHEFGPQPQATEYSSWRATAITLLAVTAWMVWLAWL